MGAVPVVARGPIDRQMLQELLPVTVAITRYSGVGAIVTTERIAKMLRATAVKDASGVSGV